MEFIICIVLTAVLAAAITICCVVFKKSRKQPFRNDIHISGGADINTGKISTDNNYFKGLSENLSHTVVVNNNYRENNTLTVNIYNFNSKNNEIVKIINQIDIGRSQDKNTFCVDNDKMVSMHHCRLFIKDRKLYLCDLNSLNHTYLNKKIVSVPVNVKSGDIIGVGATKLKVVY